MFPRLLRRVLVKEVHKLCQQRQHRRNLEDHEFQNLPADAQVRIPDESKSKSVGQVQQDSDGSEVDRGGFGPALGSQTGRGLPCGRGRMQFVQLLVLLVGGMVRRRDFVRQTFGSGGDRSGGFAGFHLESADLLLAGQTEPRARPARAVPRGVVCDDDLQ